ncbi:MAG TPA: hypothetical protein VFW68_02960 [Rhodocyclaceae bacterium]|nr:hypothetical protein [Rhodocyclaceae bacterium]
MNTQQPSSTFTLCATTSASGRVLASAAQSASSALSLLGLLPLLLRVQRA